MKLPDMTAAFAGASRRFAPVWRLAAVAASLAVFPAPGFADDDKPAVSSGYLCCNVRVYDDWISDINYRFDGTAIIPAGTKAWVKDVGRYSFTLSMAGKTRSLGNDYSRSLSADAFLTRYLVPTSPRVKIRTWSPDIQDAVRRMRVMVGMSEEQVLTAIGYPPHNYTPDLKASVWQYWLDRSSQFDLHWDEDRLLKRVKADPVTRRKVTWRPRPKPVAPPDAGQPPLVAPQETLVPKRAPVQEFQTFIAPGQPAVTSHQSLRNALSLANTVR